MKCMNSFNNAKIYVADFETTVFSGQDFTEVWAAAIVELGHTNVDIFNSIDLFFEYVFTLKQYSIIYFHNLKFDGSFIIPFLIEKLKFTQPIESGELAPKKLKNNQFSPVISDKGVWYKITIKYNNIIYEIRDSLKLLPFSVKTIGKGFKTAHKKSQIEYKGRRKAGGVISEKEKDYIANDVLVVKEALEIMFRRGHKKLTIGSCCMEEFKNTLKNQSSYDYSELSPDLYAISAPSWTNCKNADEFIRKAYKGGYSYVNPKIQGKVVGYGCVADYNSLYPSVMTVMDYNYPIGAPMWHEGPPTPKLLEKIEKANLYFYIKFSCRFYLKKNFLPTIQIKGDIRYRGNEWLQSSDIIIDGVQYASVEDNDKIILTNNVTLTLSMTDWKLFTEHYHILDLKIQGLCIFYTSNTIYNDYIEKYRQIKENSEGAERTLAKLYSNNLYGQEAKSVISSYKIPYIKDTGILGFNSVYAEEKQPGFIARGAAITSYARFTEINFLQANYKHFLYADTDSGHFSCKPEQVKGAIIDSKKYGCIKIEKEFDKAIFARQKTYVEHVIREDEKDVEPYHSITCAGMGSVCKEMLSFAFDGKIPKTNSDYWNNLNNDCKEFLLKHNNNPISYDDFNRGILEPIPGQLRPTRIKGGIVLKDDFYNMK